MSPHYSKLKFLKVNDIYQFQIMKIMYRINQQNWIGNYNLVKTNTVHSHFTRISNSSNFFIEANTSNNSINKIGPKLWQSIPNTTKLLEYKSFKKSIQDNFISSY